jgi:hypothetical protein
MLKGAANLDSYRKNNKAEKTPITLSMLKLIGHEICTSDWSPGKKAVFWAACTVAFFGSFRLGELLCSSRSCFTKDNLVWSDITFNGNDSVTVHVRHPKTNKKGGEKIEVFSFKGHNCCPVKALKKLAEAKVHDYLPVFAFTDRDFLDKKFFTDTVLSLLDKHIPGHSARCHSFRAGIPSALSARPDLVSTDEIQQWGRWSSNSYKAYALHAHLARKDIFRKYEEAIGDESQRKA